MRRAAGRVYAFKKNGSLVDGWPKIFSDMATTPVLGDIDDDGQLEILCTSIYPHGWIYAWESNGEIIPGWPFQITPIFAESPLALADIDQDNVLEIIVCSDQNLWVFNGDGSTIPGWPVSVGKVLSPPVIGDIDADDKLEIIIGYGSHNNQIIAFNEDGSCVSGWPLITSGWIANSPALGDIDRNNGIELII